MKKFLSILAIATVLVFTSSCSKDDGPEKSTLESLSNTEWTGSTTVDGYKFDYNFTFSSNELVVLVSKDDVVYATLNCTYSYENPVVSYTSKSSSSKTGNGIVSKDGKTMTINGDSSTFTLTKK